MKLVANLLIGGIVTGSVYALVAIGFVVLYRSTRVFSLAQGSFMVLGATFLYAFEQAGLGLLVAGLAAIALTAALGGAAYYFLFSGRLLAAEPLTVAMATIALSTAIDMVVDLHWGTNPLELPHLFSFRPIHMGGLVTFSRADLTAFVSAVAVVVLVLSLLRWTRLGLRMRATADSPGLAVYFGVPVRLTCICAWSIGALCAGLAGIVSSIGSGQVDAVNLTGIGLAAFPAILLGGLESVGGVALASILIGLVESVGGYFFGSLWGPVIPYFVLFVVLLVRPNGLFGIRRVSRI